MLLLPGIFNGMKAKIIYKFSVFLMLTALPALLHGQSAYEVKPISTISGSSDDIVAAIEKNGIIFCSNRKTSPLVTRKNLQGQRIFDLYFAPFNSKKEIGLPEVYAPELKGKFNLGPGCFSTDGKKFYFTRNYNSGKSRKVKGETDKFGIFIAHKSGNEWTDVTPFEYNDQRYKLAYPFISGDGKYLFFSSDMDGTIGKSDIFVCENEDGKWGKPADLGPVVNSTASEVYPFFSSSGRLYFSSDRKGGKGGLDIYYSVLQNGVWSTPVLLDEPINSKGDDFAFYTLSSDQSGYFSSDRSRKGDDDIYSFKHTIVRWADCDSLKKDSFCYEFVEETALLGDSSSMEYKWQWDFGDSTKTDGITATHCFKEPGSYYIQLNFVNLITGKIELNQASYLLDVERVVQPYITSPDVAYVGDDNKMDASLTNLPGWNIDTYYWNFDDDSYLTGSAVTKRFRRPGKFNLQLIISSIPDDNGNVKEACVCKDIIIKPRNK